MNKEENNNLEKSNSKYNESIINMNELNNNIKNINIKKYKNELLQKITPKINEVISQKDNSMNNNPIPNINFNESEEYNKYREKKMKLYNFYQTLLNFRQKLIIKEKHLNQREKNLLEFEKILKANETILKNNIDQFEIYMRNKIYEIKTQFNKIEQLQLNKEKFLKLKEEEINTENNYINSLQNLKRCSKCNCPIFNEEEINKQIINNNYYDSCNNNLKNIFHQKAKSINNKSMNDNVNFIEQNNLEPNNENTFKSRNFGGIYNNSNDFNYSCFCPACNFCNI